MTAGDPLGDALAELEAVGAELATLVQVALPQWAAARVMSRSIESGTAADPATEAMARAASEAVAATVRREIVPGVQASLLSGGLGGPTPLALVRSAVEPATAALEGLGVPGVVRDPDAVRMFPNDEYDLIPGNWGEIDPALQPLGLKWSAAMAMVVLQRRSSAG